MLMPHLVGMMMIVGFLYLSDIRFFLETFWLYLVLVDHGKSLGDNSK